MKKELNLRISFDKNNRMNGRMRLYANASKVIEIKSSETFEDTMTYGGYKEYATYLTRIYMVSESGTTYSMFFSEFNKIINLLKDGKISGKWGFRKHAQQVSLKYFGE